MAYVRKTDQMLSDIRSNIFDMERKAKAPYETSNVDTGSTLFNAIRASFETSEWSCAPELKAVFPKAWLKEHDNVIVSLIGDDGVQRVRVDLNAPDNDPFLLPISVGNYRARDVPYVHLNQTTKDYLAGAVERDEKVNAIQDSYRTTREQLTAFLTQHASLNAALTAMPELELYVPDSYMEKVRAKTVRPPKVQSTVASDLNIDVDALAAAAIAHRMSMAGAG